MTDTDDDTSLYDLLPLFIRERDIAVGEPLRKLLDAVDDQVRLDKLAITRLYDNWFVDTCEQTMLPLIADLIGYQPLPAEAHALNASRARQWPPYLRRSIADAIATRRRKGTPPQVSALGPETAGWPSHLVESTELVASTWDVDDPVPPDPGTFPIADELACEDLGGAFDTQRRTPAITAPGSTIPPRLTSAALVVWRAMPEQVPRVPAHHDSGHLYTFDWLGNDTALLPRPSTAEQPDGAAGQRYIAPHPLGRTAVRQTLPHRYGPAGDFCLWTGDRQSPIPINLIDIADLTHFPDFHPGKDRIAIDPRTGRIAYPAAPKQLWVSYVRARDGLLGGGAYPRGPLPSPTRIVQPHDQLILHPRTRTGTSDPLVVQLSEGRHRLPESLRLHRNEHLVIQAPPDSRVEAIAGDRQSTMLVSAAHPSEGPNGRPSRGTTCFTLDGVLFDGTLTLDGHLDTVLIRHCTLVPRHPSGHPVSITINGTVENLRIENSMIGAIRVATDSTTTVHVQDSVLDAGPDRQWPALASEDPSRTKGGPATVRVTLARSTVFGPVIATSITATDCILTDGCLGPTHQPVNGQLRYTYLPAASAAPRGTGCQPLPGDSDTRPIFQERRYGGPGYARLAPSCPEAIRRGSHDGAEMGAFHHLDEPARADSLAQRLAESLPPSIDPTMIWAS